MAAQTQFDIQKVDSQNKNQLKDLFGEPPAQARGLACKWYQVPCYDADAWFQAFVWLEDIPRSPEEELTVRLALDQQAARHLNEMS